MAGSARSCCIPYCGTTLADNITLHAFPHPEKEKERFIMWVNAVGSDLSTLDHQFIYKNRKICHDHFDERYLTWTKRLSAVAVPTLRIPGLRVRDVVMRDITNIVTVDLQANHGLASTSSGLSSLAEPEQQTVPMDFSVKKPLKCKQKGMKSEINNLRKMLMKVTKKKDNYATRLKKALILSENVTFQNVMKKFTTLAAIFYAMQLREIPKKKMGRRFTEKEKLLALSMYKQGPRCYRFLSKIFVLPSPLTLSRLIRRADLKAGINEKLLNVMKKKVKKMNNDEKLCILLFDEIALTPHFDYNQRKDSITGFVTNGKTKEQKIGDHALVFMIRGVLRNYKQPVAYTFSAGSTKQDVLCELITEIIRALHHIGLRVVATVCDQGASNVSSIRHLISNTKEKYLKEQKELRQDIFEVDGEEIIPLYDPPHLIKGIRNNLLEKDLKCTINGQTKVAKWEHLKLLYQENPEYKGLRLLKNFTEDHVNPEKCKMKVKFATQVFSEKVAATMGYLSKKNILPEECQQTADVLKFFDELFDSVNGSQENSKKRRGKPLLCALKPGSCHNEVWSNAKKVLSKMTFIKKGKQVNVPTINNWMHTVNNLEYLRDVLFNKYQMKSIWLRHYNQDPLENFFGAIRSHGYRNISPSPEGFEVAYTSLLINNLTGITHSKGSNCEEDSCKSMFKSMRELFKVSSNTRNMPDEVDLSYMDENIIVDFEIKKRDHRIYSQLNYVTGYLLRQTKKSIFKRCTICKENFCNKNQDNDYLNEREFNKNKSYLQYPNEEFIKMFSTMQDVLAWVMKNHKSKSNLKMYCKTVLCVEVSANFMTCNEHKNKNVDFILDLASRLYIHNWCKEINNILKGRRKDAAHIDNMKKLAIEYVSKRRKN